VAVPVRRSHWEEPLMGPLVELLVELPLVKHVFPTFLHEQVFGVNRLER
jgi:hypothetical protein